MSTYLFQKIVRKRSTFRKTRRQSCITLQRTTTEIEGTESSNIDPNAKLKRGNTFSRKKEKENQLKLTRTLLTLGIFHFLTTIMETIAFFIFTVYRTAWMNFKERYEFLNNTNDTFSVIFKHCDYLFQTLLRYNCQSPGQCELCQKLLPILLSSRRHPKNCNFQMQTSVQIQLTTYLTTLLLL